MRSKGSELPRRFSAYLLTQSLGAFNDNFFKMLIQLYVVQILVSGSSEEIISRATLLFTLPFVLFGPWSGYLADKYSKSSAMVAIKAAEIGIMLIGSLAFYLGNLPMLLAVLFLMATQSTFFGPAKYGFIPESCPPESISAANGWVEMTTFVAVILGTAVTGVMLSLHQNVAYAVALYCVGIAVIGLISSLMILSVPAAGNTGPFPWNPLTGIIRDLAFLKKQKGLFLAALANSFFWMLGLTFQTNILIYGKKMLGDASSGTVLLSLMPAFMGIGIAAGSMLASRWSGKKVELGLVPLGGLGMAAAGISLYFSTASYIATCSILFLAGIFGGLYIVPLYSYLQFYARKNEKGRVLATAGILIGLFLVLGSLLYRLLAVDLNVSAPTIFLYSGILTIVAVAVICCIIPEYFIRFCFWLLTHTFYRIKIVGIENVPFRGAALLAPNHVSYVDAFLIGATLQRFVRFVLWKRIFDIRFLQPLFKIMNVISFDPAGGRQAVKETYDEASYQLQGGHVVCLFPEGKITRSGEIGSFQPNLAAIMPKLDCPIIPVYLENVWGSIFSFESGRPMSKWPKKIPFPISVHYGKPLPPQTDPSVVEAAVRALAENRPSTFDSSLQSVDLEVEKNQPG